MTKNSNAFGAPGIEPRWTSSAKTGIGTAYNSASCVWFTLSHGMPRLGREASSRCGLSLISYSESVEARGCAS